MAERQSLIPKALPLFQQKEPHFAKRFTIGYWLSRILTKPDQYEILSEQRNLGQ